MSSLVLPSAYSRIRCVGSFEELAAVPFANGVNAVCWERALPLEADFAEVVERLGPGEGIVGLEEERLQTLALSVAGRVAVEFMLADLARLQRRELAPVLNCIYGYPRDEEAGPVVTDVFSFHADSAPVPAETWLCTYFGPASEGLRNEEAHRRVDLAETRAELLRIFGGEEGEAFQEFLRDHCYDLHYAPAPGARPFSFGLGSLWRIAVEHPDCPVPPCVHRAPDTQPGQSRLLLIS